MLFWGKIGFFDIFSVHQNRYQIGQNEGKRPYSYVFHLKKHLDIFYDCRFNLSRKSLLIRDILLARRNLRLTSIRWLFHNVSVNRYCFSVK